MKVEILINDITENDVCNNISFSVDHTNILCNINREYFQIDRVKNISEIANIKNFLYEYKTFRNIAEKDLEIYLLNITTPKQHIIFRNRLKMILNYVEENLTNEQRLYLECMDI